eukprot:10692835-Karenia_brevis.AAC.1
MKNVDGVAPDVFGNTLLWFQGMCMFNGVDEMLSKTGCLYKYAPGGTCVRKRNVNLQETMNRQIMIRENIKGTCLLYTSPSPRDTERS